MEIKELLYSIERICELMDADTLKEAVTVLHAAEEAVDELLGVQLDKESV